MHTDKSKSRKLTEKGKIRTNGSRLSTTLHKNNTDKQFLPEMVVTWAPKKSFDIFMVAWDAPIKL